MSFIPRRAFSVAVLVAVAAVAAAGVHANHAFYHDDAFIGLRYARNLIAGHGLVWNPGERVEGYSNFLLTVLVAALGAARVDLVAATRIINASALAALLLFLWLQGARLAGGNLLKRPLGALAFVLVLASFPMIAWVFGGLEGPLFAALSAGGIWLLRGAIGRTNGVRALALAGVLLALACMTRMGGLIFATVSGVFLASEPVPTRSRFSRLGVFVAAFGAVFLPYYIWRCSYYGSPLPNTFWVKAAGFSWIRLGIGARYVLSSATVPPFTFLLTGAAVVRAVARRALDRRAAYLLVILASYVAYVAYVGGCQMPAYRLLLPMIPVAALLATSLLAPPEAGVGRAAEYAIVAAVVLLLALQARDDRVNLRHVNPAAFIGTIVGEYIDENWPANSLVALSTAGSTPFVAEDLRFIDMLGLNDVHIAHREITRLELPWQLVPGHLKGDGAYVLSRRPDYIILGPAEGTTTDAPWFLSGLEISRDPRFEADYVLRQVELDVSDRRGFEQCGPTRTGVLTFTYYERRPGSSAPPAEPER
jgi:arabinofuranosyltransferase